MGNQQQHSWNVVFIILLILIILFILYSLLFYTYNGNIIADNEALAQKLQYGPLQSLLNGSGINNIPTLNIISTNIAINTANNCGKGPVLIGSSSSSLTDFECVKICANSGAKSLIVKSNESYFYESSALNEGSYCIIGHRPECNTHATIVLMTVNSVVCRSKYPRIVGGPLGTKVIACNNRAANDPQNILWDYKFNERFDPLQTTILDEDETLPDGTFRFRCKFGGKDALGNFYQAHPFDRFHPISNYCAALLYRAHPDVKTVFEGRKYTCDCGDRNETRVENLIPSDKTSQCSPYTLSKSYANNVNTLTIPYPCFTLFSPITDVGRYFPCPADKFTREGLRMNNIIVQYTEDENTILEHPLYTSFSSDGLHVLKDRIVT